MEYKFELGRKRIVAIDENGTEAGKCLFTIHEGYWSIDHTYVNPDYRGRNIAENLVDGIVTEARKAGVKILPVCSYALKQFERKEEYQDIRYTDAVEKPAE